MSRLSASLAFLRQHIDAILVWRKHLFASQAPTADGMQNLGDTAVVRLSDNEQLRVNPRHLERVLNGAQTRATVSAADSAPDDSACTTQLLIMAPTDAQDQQVGQAPAGSADPRFNGKHVPAIKVTRPKPKPILPLKNKKMQHVRIAMWLGLGVAACTIVVVQLLPQFLQMTSEKHTRLIRMLPSESTQLRLQRVNVGDVRMIIRSAVQDTVVVHLWHSWSDDGTRNATGLGSQFSEQHPGVQVVHLCTDMNGVRQRKNSALVAQALGLKGQLYLLRSRASLFDLHNTGAVNELYLGLIGSVNAKPEVLWFLRNGRYLGELSSALYSEAYGEVHSEVHGEVHSEVHSALKTNLSYRWFS